MDFIAVALSLVLYIYPLAVIGLWLMIGKWVIPWINTRKGMILISRIMGNGHIRHIWVKPEIETSGRDVAYYISLGEKKPWGRKKENEPVEKFPFYDSPGLVYFEGGIKRAFYDSEGNQVSINEAKKFIPSVNPKMFDSVLQRTWHLARASVFSEKKNLYAMVLIAMFAAIGACLLVAGLYAQMDGLNSEVARMTHLIDQLNGQLTILRQTGGLAPT